MLDKKNFGLIPMALLALGAIAFTPIAPAQSLANPGENLAAVLPVVGSTPGNFGSYFKTAVQVHNASTSVLNVRFAYHPAGRSGATGDPSLAISIGPQQTAYFEDMLPAMGVATGLGSLDVFVPIGSSPRAATVVRVFNDAGAAGTSGFTEEFVPVDAVIGTGQTAFLVSPPDFASYRFNIGVRTLDQGATLRVRVRDAGGAVTRTVTKTYAPNFFEQTASDAFLGAPLAGNESLAIEVTAGAAVVYSATTDNQTNDPSYQRAPSLD